jgi:peptidase E
MKVFLTSSPGGQIKINGIRTATVLNSDNGFIDMLRKEWKEKSKVLLIAASPDEPEINDSIRNIFAQSFPMSGLDIGCIDICDDRNLDVINRIYDYDTIVLSGGHVPTQNKFFEKISLKKQIKNFNGILIGISAGTMNSAEEVYAQPELDGESIDKDYKRFICGLGITSLMILPHYQDIKDDILDGKRVMEDIAYPDSVGREFYALVDGSFIYIENGKETLYGEGYLIKNGAISKICELN